MPDLPIVIPDIASAPKDYTLSGTQELALKTVRALIDGTGAGAAFLPTLQLLDPNGHVMWEGATSSTVAAGGSADVSWFPGLGGSSGSSSTSPLAETAYLHGLNGGPLTVPSGSATHNVPWLHFQTTNTSVFGTDTSAAASPPFHNSPGDTFIYLQADGAYLASGLLTWDAGAYAQGMIVDNPGFQWALDSLGSSVAQPEDLPTNASPGDFVTEWGPSSQRMFYVDGADNPGIINMLPVQKSGVNKTVFDATLGIVYLGGDTGLLASVY